MSTPETVELLNLLHRGGKYRHIQIIENGNCVVRSLEVGKALPEYPPQANISVGIHPLEKRSHEIADLNELSIARLNSYHAFYSVENQERKDNVIKELLKLPLVPTIIIDAGSQVIALWSFEQSVLIDDANLRHYHRVQQRDWILEVNGDADKTSLNAVIPLPGTLVAGLGDNGFPVVVNIIASDFSRKFFPDHFQEQIDSHRTRQDLRNSLGIISACELRKKKLRQLTWWVEGLLTEGLTLLVGRSSIGKSYFALSMSCAVAQGKDFIGLRTTRGGVLFLALEDSEERLQYRLSQVAPDCEGPEGLEVKRAIALLSQGGMRELEDSLKACPEVKIIIVDLLEKIRGMRRRGNSVYAEEYELMRVLRDFSRTFHVAVLVVHHTKKGSTVDYEDQISGTMGLQGGADNKILMEKVAGSGLIKIRAWGRDIQEQEYAVRFNGQTWECQDSNYSDFRNVDQQELLNSLKELLPGGADVNEISRRLGIKYGTARNRLLKLEQYGLIRSIRKGGKVEYLAVSPDHVDACASQVGSQIHDTSIKGNLIQLQKVDYQDNRMSDKDDRCKSSDEGKNDEKRKNLENPEKDESDESDENESFCLDSPTLFEKGCTSDCRDASLKTDQVESDEFTFI